MYWPRGQWSRWLVFLDLRDMTCETEPRTMQMNTRRTKAAMIATIGLALLCIAALVAHALSYLPYFPDDAFISLRYSQRFLEGKGLTWTDGERVEGFTNFLWVVTVAGLGTFGADLVATARALGVLGMSAVIAAIFYAFSVTRPKRAIAPMCASLAFAGAGPVAAYAISGLEHPLLVALLIWGIVLCRPLMESDDVGWRQLWGPGLLLGLSCTVRPDAPLLVGMVIIAVAVGAGLSRKRLWIAARLAVFPGACFGALLLFRRLYYSDWVPNTYYAKVALTAERLASGWDYVSAGGWPFLGLLVLVGIAVAVSAVNSGFRRRALLPLLPLVAWLTYLTFIGGDNMPQRRHLVPAIALAALIAAEVLAWMVERTRKWQFTALGLGLAMVAQVGIVSVRDPQRAKAKGNVWMWRGQPAGLFLKRAFGEQQPLMAVDAAGALPYFSELPVIDMLGLNDYYIARHRPKSFGRGRLAHELGDGDYVMRRAPDLIAFHTARGEREPMWLSGRQMVHKREFRKLYQLVKYRTPPPEKLPGFLWIRKEDGVLGMTRRRDEILVPGYFVTMLRGNEARLDPEGMVAAVATRELPAALKRFPVDPGLWQLSAVADQPVEIVVRTASGEELARGMGSLELELPGEASTRVFVALEPTGGDTAYVRELRFERRATRLP